LDIGEFNSSVFGVVRRLSALCKGRIPGVNQEGEPMNANTLESKTVAADPRRQESWAPVIALGITVGSLALYAVFSAPAMLQAAERANADQIRQENHAHCEKFQMPPGSEGFASCVTDLTEIRRRQRDRFVAEAAGIL
jgi:hypothetical protein